VLNFQRRVNVLLDDVPGMVIVDDFSVLQLPRLGFRTEKGARRDVIRNNIVVAVLFKHLNVVERIGAREKILDKPGAQVRTITKNLSLDVAPGA
jgi:hypothetical protein